MQCYVVSCVGATILEQLIASTSLLEPWRYMQHIHLKHWSLSTKVH